MNRIFQWLLIAAALSMFAGCSTTYLGKVDVMGIGIGPKPATGDIQYVDASSLNNVEVAYTPDIEIIEQEVSDTVKFVAGEALIKEYKGQPEMIAAWMNETQGVTNAALLIDKEGVVAWHGNIRRAEVGGANGVEGYGIFSGAKRLTLDEALKKYVGDGEEQDYEDDKVIKFEKGFFDYGKEGPFVYTKLPDFMVTKANGEEININSIIMNGKPTLLVFFMAKGKDKADLMDVVDTAASVASMLSGGEAREKPATPQTVLSNIESIYLIAK